MQFRRTKTRTRSGKVIPMTDNTAFARAVVIFLRIVQGALVLAALITSLGALSMNIIAALSLLVFGLVLLGFAGVTEGVIRLVRGRWG